MDKEKGQTKGKGMATSKDKENVQFLHKNNSGVVIREARDLDPISIRMDSNIRIMSKASLAQRARRERERFVKRVRLELNTIAQVQLLRENNVGVVIREVRDFNPISIRMEQKKDKEKGKTVAVDIENIDSTEQVTDKDKRQTKEKGMATSNDKENVDPLMGKSRKQTNVTIFGKCDRYVKHAVELLRKENVHVHIKAEREYNSIRIREEKNNIKLSKRKDNKFSEAYEESISCFVLWSLLYIAFPWI